MGIRKYKPTTPGRRGSSVSDFAEITRSRPEKSLVRPLHKSIRTVEDFKRIGELSAFVKLVQHGSFASETLLFKLYGAVRQKYIYTLSEQEKKALLADADLALYNAGLRKRFIGCY